MDIIKRGFGSQLKAIRKLKNFTQEKLAEEIGINLRQLARIEAGESFVSSETLFKICDVLEISPQILFDFDILESSLKTGTDNTMHFSVIKAGNVIQLIPSFKAEEYEKTEGYNSLSKDFDAKMKEIAKRTGKDIFVDEIQDGNSLRTKVFKPSGDIEIKDAKDENVLLEMLKDKILSVSNDKKKLEFINLAIDSLTDKNALNELKTLIKGIELIQE